MNNESARRLMIKERERREAKIKAEAEAREQEAIKENEIPETDENITEVEQDVITDSENGDNEQDTEP